MLYLNGKNTKVRGMSELGKITACGSVVSSTTLKLLPVDRLARPISPFIDLCINLSTPLSYMTGSLYRETFESSKFQCPKTCLSEIAKCVKIIIVIGPIIPSPSTPISPGGTHQQGGIATQQVGSRLD